MEVKRAEQQDDGSWKIIYSYDLNGEQAHPQGGAYNDGANIGANDFLSDSIGITVTDATGDTATGALTVTVHDDGPVLTGLSNSTGAEAMLNESTGPLVVSLEDFHTGADMANGTTPAKVTVAVGGQTYAFTVSSGTHGYVFTPEAGQGNAVSIEHGENGYELHYTRPEGDVQSSGTPSYTFTVTVTDADGDSVSKNITLTTKDRPDISFGTNEDITDEGSVKEAGVAGHFPADGENANSTVPGNDTASGTITLTDTDSAALTLTVTGNVQHTDNSETHDNTEDAQVSSTSFGGNGFSLGTGGTLTLYLNADGELVTAAGLAENEDYYGTLTLNFSAGKTGSWNFTLNEGSNLVDSLKEGESFDITLNLTANDGTQNDRGYTSDDATLTIHIQGTNDKPVFTTEVTSVGDLVATDETGGVDNVPNSVSGTLTATDADADNGAGSDIAAVNGLTFTVTGLAGTDAGNVDANGGYASYGSGFNYNNLVSSQRGEVTSGSDNDGSFTQVTTAYGTLKVYADGSYTYEANDTSKIGGDEYVTETFTVKVQDAHGSWDTQTITITLRDEDNGITGGADISQSLREEGVVGDDESLVAKYGDDDPNEHVSTDNGTAAPDNVLFTDVDLNDTVTLTIGKTDVNLVQADGTSEGTVGSIALASGVTVGIVGSSSTVLYLVAAENSDGTWSFSWSTEDDGDVVGELTLSRKDNGDVFYDFALDPNNKLSNTAADNSSFLERLDQGDEVEIKLDFTAGGATSHVELTITGTNDRPTVSFADDSTAKKQDTLYASGVGREDDADVVTTGGASTLNPAEMNDYTTSGTVSGNLKASDPDAGDSTTFFISNTTSTSNKISFSTSEGSNTVTVLLDGEKVGTLVLNPETGRYAFDLERGDGNPLQKYAEGTRFSFTVNFKAEDSHTSTSANSVSVEITLAATNDAPVITASEDMNLSVAESGSSDSARVTATDIDTTDTLTYGLLSDAVYDQLVDAQNPQSVQMTNSISLGNWGTVTMASDGTYTFYLNKENPELAALRKDEVKELTFHVVVRDDKGAYDIKDVTISIEGEASSAVFRGSASVGVVTEAGVTPPAPAGDENGEVKGIPSVSGKLEAVAIDHDNNGNAQEVQYSVNGHEDAETKSFSSLDSAVQTAINDKFGGNNWTADADVTVVQGTYGTLYLNNNTGQYFYQLDNGNEATNALKQGEIKNENFTIHAEGAYDAAHGGANGADRQLIISVQGTNDAPTLDGVRVGGQTVSPDENGKFIVSGVQEDGVQQVSGSLVGDDVDSAPTSLTYLIKVADGENSYRYLASASNDYGFLTLDESTGEYTFTLNNKAVQYLPAGEFGQTSFTVVVKDEHGAISEEKELVFKIEGANDTASINSVTLETNEDAKEAVSGGEHTITISDVDNSEKMFTSVSFGGKTVELTDANAKLDDDENPYWTIEGDYGTLTLTKDGNGLSYKYEITDEAAREKVLQALNKGESETEEFIVRGTAGDEETSGKITVTINGEDDAPYDLFWNPRPDVDENYDIVENFDGAITDGVDGSVLNVRGWDSVGGTVIGNDKDNDTSELRYYVANGAADPDQEQNTSTLQTVKGEYGYLTINAQTGEFSYTVDTLSDAYQGTDGEWLGQESFTIIVADPYGKTHEETIHFDVYYHSGDGGGQAPVLGDDQTPVDVDEDDGKYFETDAEGQPVHDAEGNPIDLTPPPFVESKWEPILDENGNQVDVVPSAIWLVDDNDGRTHTIQTDYGSLILERGDEGKWGYRFVLDNSSPTVQQMDEGEKEVLTFHVQTSEMGKDETSTITVTVTGLNDRPVIEAHEDLVVSDTENSTDSGKLTTSDPDAGDVGTGEVTGEGETVQQNLSYSVSSSENCSVGEPKEKENGDLVYTVTGTWKDASITWGEFTLHENGSYSFTASDAAKVLLKGENPTFHLTIEANDGSDALNATTSTEVAITIQGTNEAPVITSADTIFVTEDTVLTDSEKLTVTDDRHDADGNPTGLTYAVSFGNGAWGPIAEGDYGSLYVRADGTYAYQLNNQLQAVQELESGKTLTETFTIYVTDADGEVVPTPVTVTINGTDDAPVLSLDAPVLTVKEGAENAVEGKATATDADKVDQGKLSYSFDGGSLTETDEGGNTYSVLETDYGTFRINTQTGEYSFTIDNDSEAVKNLRPTDVKDVLATVVVSNGRENSVEQTLTVHVSGSETAPEVTVEGSVKPNWTDTGAPVGEGWGGSDGFIGKIQATGWDAGPDPEHPDTDTLSYALDGSHPVTMGGKVWRVATTPKGTLYLNPETGEYRYEPSGNVQTLSEGEEQKDFFTVTVTDSTGKTVETSLSVIITGTNQEPEISSNAVSGNIGTLTFSDIDANDTHTVTFDDLYASEAGKEGAALSVNTAEGAMPTGPVDVYNENGVLVGTMQFGFVEGGNNQGNKFTYTFMLNDAYENSLEVGTSVDVSFNLTVTDSAKTTGRDSDDSNKHFTITNANDEVMIADGQLADVTIDSADESAGGSFTFTDKDVKDTHTVSSSVQVKLPDGKTADATVENGEVTLEDGTVLGTLEVTHNNDSTGGEPGKVSYTFKPSSEYLTSLGKDEATQLDLTFTVSDGNDSEKTTSVSVTLKGSNDAVNISSDNFSTTPNEDGVYTGSLVFSDADVTDTHTVTFEGLYGAENGTALSVNTAADSMPTGPVPVYDGEGVLIGMMEFDFVEGSNNQNNELSYTFTPVDPNSLPVGDHSVKFTVSVDDGNGSATSLNTEYIVGLTNENDVVSINTEGTSSSLTPNEDGAYTGSLVFSDADVTDTHTVTFKGESLKTLSVNTATLSENSSPVEVYNAEGVKIGTMVFTFTKGENDTNTLSYTFTPAEDLTEDFSVELSVSDGHETETELAPTVNVTFNKPVEELPEESEGSGDDSDSEQEQARVEQENGLLTAAMVVSGLNGVLDASFDAPLFDAQTDAPDVPEGQDTFAADSLVLPNTPDAPAFAVADASAEHAAPQMFSLHADPVIPEATMHESAAAAPDASPADDASSDAPDLISLLADNDPGAPEHGFLFSAPEGDVFSGSDGNDYMAGGEGSDAVMAGDGNDIVVYDASDYLIDGGSGIDFIVSDDNSLSLHELLTESGRDGHDGPMVNGVEVLIKGDDALSLTSMDQLSKDYGVTIDRDAQGNETLTLNADQWHANGDGSFDYVGKPDVDLTLETSLTPVTHDDAADAAVQQQVFILQNTQG